MPAFLFNLLKWADMPGRKTEKLKTVCLFLITAAFSLTACRAPQKTDMRTLAPLGTLVYLETNDVAAALESLTASPAFQTLVQAKPDFAALQNIQLAVVVTGFDTSEENSVLSLKPRFVAVVETHAWSWQTVSLAENQLDTFVRKNYGETAKLEKKDQDGGKYFVWTADDNRQVFAFVQDSLIYFGNDAAAIEKCLAVKKGETENLTRNESFTRVYGEKNLAFGYASTDGIKRIADLAGVSVAVNASDETDERIFIARILPQILQNTTKEIVWMANRTENGIEDRYAVNLTDETASGLKENLNSNADITTDSVKFLPTDVFSATRYNLTNPSAAWRSSMLLTAKNTDALSGKMLIGFSGRLLEPYGVSEADIFLSAGHSPITTAQFDAEGAKSVTIAEVKDSDKLKSSISKEIDFNQPPKKLLNAEIWFSEDKSLAAAFIAGKLILGDGESVLECLNAKLSRPNAVFQRFAESRAVAATFGTDVDSADKIAKVLANKIDPNRRLATFYTTETRLTAGGFERVTISDFGLIGAILKNIE